jgi:hypothetical protein
MRTNRGSLGAGELTSALYNSNQNFGKSSNRGMFFIFCNSGTTSIAAGGGNGTVDLLAGSYWEAPRAFSIGTFEVTTTGSYSVFTNDLAEV